MREAAAPQLVRRSALAAFLLLATPWPAAAGLHQICYRDLTNPAEPVAVQARCRSDSPAISCVIQVPPTFMLLSTYSDANSRSEIYRAPDPTATYSLTYWFSDGTQRSCTVEMGVPHASFAMPAQGKLAGYTTDASGLVMTGIWRKTWKVQAASGNGMTGLREFFEVPTDFFVTGGGAVGGDLHNAAMINNLQAAGSDVWETGTVQLPPTRTYVHEGHGIAMKIEGLSHADLSAVLEHPLPSRSPAGASPSVTNPVPPGWLVVGGGGFTSLPPYPQFFTTFAPSLWMAIGCLTLDPLCQPVYAIDGWTVSSKDHVVSAPRSVAAEAVLMLPEVFIKGRRYAVEVSVATRTSKEDRRPSVTVQGTPGEYALTGVGASVDWRTYGSAGNLLWKLLPRPDIAGAEAASTDHTYVSPATITAYAIGVKLVPIPFD